MDKNKDLLKNILIPLIVGAFLIIIYLILNYDNSDGYVTKNKFVLKDYEINEVIPIYITDEDMAKKYLADYIYLAINFPDKAYDALSDEDNSKFDYDSYKKYIDSLINDSFVRAKVVEYSYVTRNGYKDIYIVDEARNRFIFHEYSIMDYKVSIN